MRFDLIIPTYNRSELLDRALASVDRATSPEGMTVRVTVVDNNSTDDTQSVVEAWGKRFAGSLTYLHETRRGRSSALNAGISSTDGDIVGMIDDDEEICTQWFVEAQRLFAREQIDFIGGPCLPRWGAERPDWLPKSYRGVIGWVENGDEEKPFDNSSPAILTGGNSIIRRSVLERAGLFSTALGRTDKRLLSCEDEEFYHRLLATGARGRYTPGLVIYHYVPAERLTRRYHRSWCFWRAVSLGLLERQRKSDVAYLFGVPRYMFGNAVRGLLRYLSGPLTGVSKSDRFDGELAAWDLAGILYGRHFFRAERSSDNKPIGKPSTALPGQ